MTSEPPNEARVATRWVSRMPDAFFFLLLSALAFVGLAGIRVAWDFNTRLVRMEARIEAIADRVGASDRDTFAGR